MTSTQDRPDEWQRYRGDFARWLGKCCAVYNATEQGWLPFKLWPAQVTAAELLQQHRLTVILKARQLGLSWLCVGYALWLMLFHAEATVLLFSKRDDEAVHLLNFRLQGMYARLPAAMPAPAVKVNNAHEFRLANGSAALAFPTTGGRSYTATLALVDEADHTDNLDALLNAVKPTIDAGGRLILLSTANKSQPESAFKRIYRGAVARANAYTPLFLPWSARPTRDAAWYAEQHADVMARTGALDDLFQEYPATDFEALAPRALDRRLAAEWLRGVDATADPPLTTFDIAPIRSGTSTSAPSTAFASEDAHSAQDDSLQPSALSLQPSAAPPALPGLRVWIPPAPGAAYIIGADPAEGNPQSDFSAGSVIDLNGGQVAAWAGRVEPAVFAAQIAEVSAYYNDAPALIERNNHGHAVLLWLREFATLTCLPGLDGRPGWTTTGSSKPLVFANAAELFRTANPVGAGMQPAPAPLIRDRETLAELGSIAGATLAAPPGLHDDRAIAHVLALAALRYCNTGPSQASSIAPVDIIAEADRRPWSTL